MYYAVDEYGDVVVYGAVWADTMEWIDADMLGNHGQFAKGLHYEDSAKVPLNIMSTADYSQLGHHQIDDRLVELRDIMPALLDMAGIPIPESVEGISLLSNTRRKYLYGEHYEGETATRMLRNQRYKLIYYPAGHCFQLFDLQADPLELHNLADNPACGPVLDELTGQLINQLYGDDLTWLRDGQLIGLPDSAYQPGPNRGLTAQRGWRFM